MVKKKKPGLTRKPKTRTGRDDPASPYTQGAPDAIAFAFAVWQSLRTGCPFPTADQFGLAPSVAAGLRRQCELCFAQNNR